MLMNKEIIASINNIATYALGAYNASNNCAFNVIYDNLLSVNEMFCKKELTVEELKQIGI